MEDLVKRAATAPAAASNGQAAAPSGPEQVWHEVVTSHDLRSCKSCRFHRGFKQALRKATEVAEE